MEPRNLPGPVQKPSRLPGLLASLRHAERGPRPPPGGAAHLPACMPAGPAYLRACLSCLSCPSPEPPLAAARARPEGSRRRTHFRFRSVPLAAPCPARAALGISGNMAAAVALARGWWRGLAGPVALSRGERGSANDRRPGVGAAFPGGPVLYVLNPFPSCSGPATLGALAAAGEEGERGGRHAP